MKDFVKGTRQLLGYVRLLIFLPGVTIVMVFAVISLAYLRGVQITEVRPDFTEAITGGGGLVAYYWIGLVSVWFILEAINAVVMARGWWLHRAEIKQDMVKDGKRLRGALSRLRGITE